ncbi:hypothetical protein HK096_003563, partial [Nowakowskiella sp. JEL0078]
MLGDNFPVRWKTDVPNEEPLKIDLDCCPLTIMIHRGILMGIEHRMSLRNPVNCALFKTETKTHLFLHFIIRYLLERNMEVEATEFAYTFRNLEYFGHALEVLLHKVLDEEGDRSPMSATGMKAVRRDSFSSAKSIDNATSTNTHQKRLLPLVVKFLGNFPNYLDVIAQCARKTEVAVWNNFFDVVEDPKDLFQRCLELGALATATSYLIIIQTLESAEVSGQMAVQLLERAFDLEDFETGGNLVRFLSSIENDEVPFDRSAVEKAANDPGFGREDAVVMDQPMPEELSYIPVLIGKHARRLLLSKRIRAMERFSSALRFSLAEWLPKE